MTNTKLTNLQTVLYLKLDKCGVLNNLPNILLQDGLIARQMMDFISIDCPTDIDLDFMDISVDRLCKCWAWGACA